MLDCLPLLDVARTRALEQAAFEAFGLDAATLMRRAAEAAWQALRRRWPLAKRIGIACGSGNNGGDGAWLAACAAREGCAVHVLRVEDRPMRGANAAAGLAAAREAGVAVATFDGALPEVDVWVDALFGIGLTRAPDGAAANLIAALNRSGRPVLALDVPSGVFADTGAAPGEAIQADATVSFFAHKRGLVTGPGRGCAGEVMVATLGLAADWVAAQAGNEQLVRLSSRGPHLPRRPHAAHKGRFGRLLVVGGAPGMGGAPRLAAEAALRCGAGLVTVATDPAHVPGWLAALPEAMCHGVRSGGELAPLLAGADGVVCGPGLGQGDWGRALLQAVLAAGLPAVLDADALNLLGQSPAPVPQAVLTPHPGEAARLLASTPAAVLADPFAAARAIAHRHAAVVVLKSAGTLVAAPMGRAVVVAGGNPGMAVPGMGDVLAGVIGALRVQGAEAVDAACLGVALHAAAGDAAVATHGEQGLLAREVIAALRTKVNA